MDKNWVIKIIKLVTGEELISLIYINPEGEQSVYPLKYPMDIFELLEDEMEDVEDLINSEDFDDSLQFKQIKLVPWMAFGENSNVEITIHSIVAISDPTKEIENLYKKIIQSIIELVSEGNRIDAIEKKIHYIVNDKLSEYPHEEYHKWIKSLQLDGIKLSND